MAGEILLKAAFPVKASREARPSRKKPRRASSFRLAANRGRWKESEMIAISMPSGEEHGYFA
jgi:hypothetical protein